MNRILLFLILLIFTQPSFSQDGDLISSYENYSDLAREVAYIHLNKTTYIKGESIGFNAYVLDKSSKVLSGETVNLYCTLSDSKGKIIKKKLILITEGVGRGHFEVDSLFTTGDYTFKAYTKWMKNFDEQNYYIEKINVIDASVTSELKTSVAVEVDAQFLPEGGHLVSGVQNTVGVIIKDGRNLGISRVRGNIVKKGDETVITSFQVNSYGIGRFNITPQEGEAYEAIFEVDAQKYRVPIIKANRRGITLSLQALKDKVAISLKTNTETLSEIKDQQYKLLLHNGYELKETIISFEDKEEVLRVFLEEDLYRGVNIFTLMDAYNRPLLERMYFNYKGIDFLESKSGVTYQVSKDTLEIKVPFAKTNTSQFHNISVSVLPEETRTYNSHHSLPSYVMLAPYVRGEIEDGSYYFRGVTAKKRYELDNLLITQGWSSYDWDTIFNDPPEDDYDFEYGINYTINLNKEIKNSLLIYPNTNSATKVVSFEEGETSYEDRFFPVEGEKIRIGEVKRKGGVGEPSLYLQFDQKEIPAYNAIDETSLLSSEYKGKGLIDRSRDIDFEDWGRFEELDEVTVVKKKEYTRAEKLQNSSFGKIDVFDDRKIRQYQFFSNYISGRGFIVNEDYTNATFNIRIRNPLTPNNIIPVIYLDNTILSDFSVLFRYSLEFVDYIEVNPTGLGGGLRGGAGIIKIYTDPKKKLKATQKTSYKEYDIPLTFSTPKRFYKPKYGSYNTTFFKEYGVIDWFPDLKLDNNGDLNIKTINNDYSGVKLFIEGILKDGTFISEIKEIKIDRSSN